MRETLFQQSPHFVGQRRSVGGAAAALGPHKEPIGSALDLEIPTARKGDLRHDRCSINNERKGRLLSKRDFSLAPRRCGTQSHLTPSAKARNTPREVSASFAP